MNNYQEIRKFRIEYWPGKTVFLPMIFRAAVELRGDFLLIGPEDGAVELPEELYLREAFTLDLSSAEAVAEFLRKHGVLLPPNSCLLPVDVEAESEAARAESRHADQVPVCPSGWRVLALEEARLHLRLVRDMVRTLDPDGRYLREFLGWGWKWESTWRPVPRLKDDKAMFLEHYLNAGLEPFRLRFVTTSSRGSLNSYLYPALCLQIANCLSEGIAFNTCGLCGGLFIRQQGPKKTNRPWKGGATFCTRDCAVTAANMSHYKRVGVGNGIPWQVKTGAAIPARMEKWFKKYFKENPDQYKEYQKKRRQREAFMERRRREAEKKSSDGGV